MKIVRRATSIIFILFAVFCIIGFFSVSNSYNQLQKDYFALQEEGKYNIKEWTRFQKEYEAKYNELYDACTQ